MSPADGGGVQPRSVAEIEARMRQALTQEHGAGTPLPVPPAEAPPTPATGGVVDAGPLIALDGDAFVIAAFRAVLGREPDGDGLRTHREALAGGMGKADMLIALRASPEGAQLGRTLLLPQAEGRLSRRLYRLPLLGRPLRLLISLLRVPGLGRDLRGLHNSVLALQHDAESDRLALQRAREMQDRLLARLRNADARMDAMGREARNAGARHDAALRRVMAEVAREPWADAVLALADRQDEMDRRQGVMEVAGERLVVDAAAVSVLAEAFEALRRDQGWTETGPALVARAAELFREQDRRMRRAEALAEESARELHDQRRRLGLILEDVRRRMEHAFSREEVERLADAQDHLLDPLYLEFENRFRGSLELIKERQRTHLPLMRECDAGTPGRTIIDVGAGRGEWLELLREEGLAALGIDLNESMVQACEARGLDCLHGDAVARLAELPAGSVGAVTGFHIIEHLPFRVMVALLDEALRVLAPGGVILFETPNPANLMVASRWFYLDPTHRNPLPGEMVAMIAEARGFVGVEIRPLHPATGSFAAQDKLLAGQLDAIFHGPQDYALVARKA